MGVISDVAAIIKEESGEVAREAAKQIKNPASPQGGQKSNIKNEQAVTSAWRDMLSTPSAPPKPEVPKYMQAKVGPTARTMDDYEKDQEKRKKENEKIEKERQANAVRDRQASAEKRAFGTSG